MCRAAREAARQLRALLAQLARQLLARYCRLHSAVLRPALLRGMRTNCGASTCKVGAGAVAGAVAVPGGSAAVMVPQMRDYMVQAMLHCVEIHAEAANAAPFLLDNVLCHALQCLSAAFREEVEVLHEAKNVVSPLTPQAAQQVRRTHLHAA